MDDIWRNTGKVPWIGAVRCALNLSRAFGPLNLAAMDAQYEDDLIVAQKRGRNAVQFWTIERASQRALWLCQFGGTMAIRSHAEQLDAIQVFCRRVRMAIFCRRASCGGGEPERK